MKHFRNSVTVHRTKDEEGTKQHQIKSCTKHEPSNSSFQAPHVQLARPAGHVVVQCAGSKRPHWSPVRHVGCTQGEAFQGFLLTHSPALKGIHAFLKAMTKLSVDQSTVSFLMLLNKTETFTTPRVSCHICGQFSICGKFSTCGQFSVWA